MWSSDSALIREGDHVILFVSRDSLECVQLDRSKSYSCKHGHFLHSDIIGQPYGSQIIAKNRKGFLYALRPTPELWTLALPHRTQILYQPDIAFITSALDIRPGSRVAEAGTGSGSFTHAVARSIGKEGKLFSFEFHGERYEKARAEFESHGLSSNVQLQQRDVVKEGLGLEDEVESVFLDLPTPESAIQTAKKAFKRDRVGRICCFSPCIEQVIKTVAQLNSHGFSDVTMYETLVRNFDVVNAALPSITTAIDRIAEVERKKGARREQQIAAAAARRDARMTADEQGADSEGQTIEIEDASAMIEPPPAKRVHLDPSLPKATKTPNKNVALQRAMKASVSLDAARPLQQVRGHTSYLTLATLLPKGPGTTKHESTVNGLSKTVSGLVDLSTQDTLVRDVSFESDELSGRQARCVEPEKLA